MAFAARRAQRRSWRDMVYPVSRRIRRIISCVAASVRIRYPCRLARIFHPMVRKTRCQKKAASQPTGA